MSSGSGASETARKALQNPVVCQGLAGGLTGLIGSAFGIVTGLILGAVVIGVAYANHIGAISIPIPGETETERLARQAKSEYSHAKSEVKDAVAAEDIGKKVTKFAQAHAVLLGSFLGALVLGLMLFRSGSSD